MRSDDPRLLVGPETLDDAGVYRMGPKEALVQTVDFFPPIVDDPVWFGRIAAANSLSDVYAMGGRPLTALNIVGFPSGLDLSVLGEILRGGIEKLREAGCALLGGHSVRDSEVKYGLAVTGLVDPERMTTNAGVRAGDRLVLTKPLGMGAFSTAIKKGRVAPAEEEAGSRQMATLNRGAAEAMSAAGARAATDITGFGLLGHSANMARESGVTIRFHAAALPIFPGSRELAREGLVSGGVKRNREQLQERIRVEAGVPADLLDVILDAETSGGLLIAIAPDRFDALARGLTERQVTGVEVGEALPRAGVDVVVAG
jgi:selenide,water dikinase